MSTAAKLVIGGGVAALGSLIGFSYTDPKRTQRRFHPEMCPPLKSENPPSREVCVEKLRSHSSMDTPLDVLVVGGGCVGTGAALDAVTRGMQVGLVEKYDYASETSSRSTKLIHGGIRYLEKAVFQLDPMQLKLVAEALRERTIMIHQAPHLCHGLPTLIPCYRLYDLALMWAGTKTYDLIAALYGGSIKYSGFVGASETKHLYPMLKATNEQNQSLKGAIRYYDGQMNDARLAFTVAMTAAAYGAAVVNYAEVTAMSKVINPVGEELIRSTVKNSLDGKTMDVYSRCVVNASGPFASQVESLSKEAQGRIENVPASGTHIIIDRKYCPRDHEAVIVPSNDGRVVFSIPWLGGCLLGTTDKKTVIAHDPKPSADDVNFLLKNIEPYVGTVPKEDVKSAWAGIRPLAKLRSNDDNSNTQNMVREHLVTVDEKSLMVSVTGGKWTTYRAMAEHTIDTVRDTVMKGKAAIQPCCTPEIVMVGARNLSSVPSSHGDLPADVHKHWIKNYGDRYHELAAIVSKDHSKMNRLVEGCPVVEAEVIWSALNEHCERVTDFICRRTRMAFVNQAQAEAAIPRVAALMGKAKDWSSSKINAERSNAYAQMNSFRTID